MEEIEKIKKRKKSIHKQIIKLEEELEKLEQEYSADKSRCLLKFDIDALKKAINNKRAILNDIKKRIDTIYLVRQSTPVYKGTEIDLYSANNDIQVNLNIPNGYIVCLHDTKTIVGETGTSMISYKNDLPEYNVYYIIDEKYRNKGLGFQSTKTLLEYLGDNGIKYISLIIFKKNIPSIKIAEKLQDIYSYNIEYEDGNSITYSFDISNKIEKNKNNTK